MAQSDAQRALVWLRDRTEPPALSPRARIALGCLLRRLQHGASINLPRTRIVDRRVWVHESRIQDNSMEWCIFYRIAREVIIVGEVLQTRPDQQMPSFAAWKALVNYDASCDVARSPECTTCPKCPECAKRPEWTEGEVTEYLGLTDAESALVDIRLALSEQFVALRCDRDWTQADLGGMLGLSQSRVSRLEEPEASVSLDLVIRSLLALGVTRAELGTAVAGRDRAAQARRSTAEPLPSISRASSPPPPGATPGPGAPCST